jgi:hypothetical protein
MKYKLIMENWRKFTTESVITLDESQMQPKFLKEFVLSESLIEEDKDPQSLSLAELQKMKPEVVISAYNDMKKNETSDRIEARMKRYQTLNRKVADADVNLQMVKHNEKYGSKIITNLFDTIKAVTNAILRTSFKTSKQVGDQTRQDHEQAVKELKQIMIDSYSPLQRELIRAIGLFTGHGYPEIRNPDKFDPKKAKVMKYVNDGIVDMFKPSKETYQKAKAILEKLVQAKIKPVAVWRGLKMHEKTKSGGFVGLDAYKKGAIINVGNMSSFTTDPRVAYQNFMEGSYDPDKNQWGTILHIPKLNRGADVDEFSRYEGDEMEIIVSGEFRIKKIEFHPRGDKDQGGIRGTATAQGKNYKQKTEITSVEQAKQSPNPPNPSKHVLLVTLEPLK